MRKLVESMGTFPQTPDSVGVKIDDALRPVIVSRLVCFEVLKNKLGPSLF